MTIGIVAGLIDELPPLAWIAILPKGGATLNLLHGRSVERFEEGFFEGAWDGAFADGRFDQAVNVFGSGGRLGQSAITFVGPSHSLEPLYIVRTDRLSAVSNSLPFLLNHCALKLDPYDFSYGAEFSAIVDGLDHAPQTLMLQGCSLTILYHHNVALTFEGAITVAPKALPPSFASYDSYWSYLRGVTNRVFGNADDSARSFRYRPVSTISSGYDSAAVAAVAKSCGCSETIGLGSSNTGEPDSGRLVAESLAMHHIEFERMGRAPGTNLSEAEFLATGTQGEDLVYSVFEETLRGRILTTGFHGGKVWEKNDPPNPNVKRGDLSGSSLGEFRLRVNFIHLPMAYIGSQRHADILRVSSAPEMATFSVGGNYDRPIPRRILEEAGVPRPLFAQAKRGASIILFQSHHSRMSRTAHQSIDAYCKHEHLYPRYMLVLWLRVVWWVLGRNLYRLCRKARKILRINKQGSLATNVARLGIALFGIKAPIYGASHPRFTILLMWAVSEIGRRYAPAGRSPLAHSTEDPRHADSGIAGAVNAPEGDWTRPM